MKKFNCRQSKLRGELLKKSLVLYKIYKYLDIYPYLITYNRGGFLQRNKKVKRNVKNTVSCKEPTKPRVVEVYRST